MNQFSPGPWDLDEGDLRTVYDLETSEIIAEVFAPLPGGRVEDYGRLIAAAPDLLAALKHALRWHDQLHASDIAMMTAAIAKAEGRS